MYKYYEFKNYAPKCKNQTFWGLFVVFFIEIKFILFFIYQGFLYE